MHTCLGVIDVLPAPCSPSSSNPVFRSGQQTHQVPVIAAHPSHSHALMSKSLVYTLLPIAAWLPKYGSCSAQPTSIPLLF